MIWMFLTVERTGYFSLSNDYHQKKLQINKPNLTYPFGIRYLTTVCLYKVDLDISVEVGSWIVDSLSMDVSQLDFGKIKLDFGFRFDTWNFFSSNSWLLRPDKCQNYLTIIKIIIFFTYAWLHNDSFQLLTENTNEYYQWTDLSQ